MKKTILIFGDSNTWGYKPENDLKSRPIRWGDSERWPGILQNMLGDGYKILSDGLSGRTTVWDDPIMEQRSGKSQIISVMDAHGPLDLFVISLGSNDLKSRFSASAQEIARGAGILVDIALKQVNDFTGVPKILLIAPAPLGLIQNGPHRFSFTGCEEKSRELGLHYHEIAMMLGVEFLDAGKVVKSSDVDGLHLDRDQHELLGRAVAAEARRIIG